MVKKTKNGIFTERQIEIINKRLGGDLSDTEGQFAKIRPRLIDIRLWQTPSKKAELKKLLTKRGKEYRPPELVKPNDEQSFNEFRQEIGY